MTGFGRRVQQAGFATNREYVSQLRLKIWLHKVTLFRTLGVTNVRHRFYLHAVALMYVPPLTVKPFEVDV